MTRGIFSTIYFQSESEINFRDYEEYFTPHPFVNISNKAPAVKDVRGTNFCNLFIQKLKDKEGLNTYRIISVIDNLAKGASGQAIQNMNLMSNFEETLGLNNMALYP